MIEELGEILVALGEKNEVDLADGLADLHYVAFGTAVTFDIPTDDVFDEVHRANMTKPRGSSPRIENKVGWTPPDVAGVLKKSRGAT